MASASDDFNRANEIPITTGNWTSPNSSSSNLVSNQIQGTVSVRSDMYWNPATFGADQYSQIRVRSVSAGAQYVYAAVRMSEGPDNAYFLRTDGAELLIIKAISGVFTTLQNCGVTIANGDIIKLAVFGNTLRAFNNGVQVGTDQASGGDLTSGRTGFSTFDESTLDDWEGGDFTATDPRTDGKIVIRGA